MTKEHYDFLCTKQANFDQVKDGWISNLTDIPMLEHIYRNYIDANFVATTWCKECIFKMMQRLSTLKEKYEKNNVYS